MTQGYSFAPVQSRSPANAESPSALVRNAPGLSWMAVRNPRKRGTRSAMARRVGSIRAGSPRPEPFDFSEASGRHEPVLVKKALPVPHVLFDQV